jgi:hypothetical protein
VVQEILHQLVHFPLKEIMEEVVVILLEEQLLVEVVEQPL